MQTNESKSVERRTTRVGRSPTTQLKEGALMCVRLGAEPRTSGVPRTVSGKRSTFPSGELYARLHLIVNKIAFANQCVERSLQERS